MLCVEVDAKPADEIELGYIGLLIAQARRIGNYKASDYYRMELEKRGIIMRFKKDKTVYLFDENRNNNKPKNIPKDWALVLRNALR
jgi:hypothetical protein